MLKKKPASRVALFRCPVWLLGCLLAGASLSFAEGPAHTPGVNDKLSGQVKNYDNRRTPLIPTLREIASIYDLPMGIEKVTDQALYEPIKVRLAQGTVAQLLSLSIQQVAGYSWKIQDGAIDVYGPEELKQASNLFNLVIPQFDLKEVTIDEADIRLTTTVVGETVGREAERRGKPWGVAGDIPQSPGLQSKRLSLSMRRAPVRRVLNRLVVLHGGVVWIARVGPDKLSQFPPGGLWEFVALTQ